MFFFFTGAVGLSFFHIIGLFKEYNSYPVQTTVTLNYGELPFPSVTICNINPIRLSLLSSSAELEETLYDNSGDGNDYSDIDDYVNDTSNSPNPQESSPIGFAVFRTSHDFESGNERVLHTYRNLSTEVRYTLGHQLDDMVHRLNFRGLRYEIHENNTKLVQSSAYGNCYIINLNESSKTSGRAKGMHIILNIETDEYIKEFVYGYGMAVSIHQPGTFPLPEQDSLILNPGHETNIGITLSKISRLGGVYGECITNDGYIFDGGSAYSVSLCRAVCVRDQARKLCGCTPYYSFEDGSRNSEDNICKVDELNETMCVESIEESIHNGKLKCNCPPQCSESIYKKTITSTKWPNSDYLEQLVKDKCASTISSLCMYYHDLISNGLNTSNDYEYFASNLLAVNIYFEDLNYDTVTEEPAYQTVRFLSDIGGAMGLYIGASLLTYVELLQLAVEIGIYFKEVYKSRLNKVAELKPK